MIHLSYVIPCYNMEKYLPLCLDSLLKQGINPNNFEIIIVNDESQDSTLQIARSYATEYHNIQVIDKKNAGVGAARNSGLDSANGTYVFFIDPDDYLADNMMPPILKTALKEQLDVITFISKPVKKHEYITQSDTDISQLTTSHLPISDGITYIADNKFKNEIWWYLVRRDFMIANKIRFIEGRWMEDAILTAQLFCKSLKIAHLDVDIHRYRILPTSAMRNKASSHYRKVIFDNANAAHVYSNIISSLDQAHPSYEPCVRRLKSRQQSFVFFLLVRLMKSDLPVSKIPPMLDGFEEIGAYPLNNFLGEDYNGLNYSFMVYIFNHKPLISPFIRFFRVFYRIFR